MSPPPKKINPSPVPVLTEMVSEDMPDIPTLTEIHIKKSAPLTDAQCQQLAKQIAPQLETLLRAKLARNFDTLLQELLREAQAKLPDLIRTALEREQPL